jgi:hypothetical protein
MLSVYRVVDGSHPSGPDEAGHVIPPNLDRAIGRRFGEVSGDHSRSARAYDLAQRGYKV